MSSLAPSCRTPARTPWDDAVHEIASMRGRHRLLAQPASDLLLRFGETHARLIALPRAQRRRVQRRLGMSLAGVALLLALGLAPTPVFAAGVVGTGTPGSCTDAALDTALSGGGAVTFNCGAAAHTITVASTKVIGANTTIDGGGLITISGGNAFQVIRVNSATTLTLMNATISGGSASSGGGIYNKGTLFLENSTVTGNSVSGDGGGISNLNKAMISGSTVSGNTAFFGGGIANGATLTVLNSTVSGNVTSGRGGGVYNNYGVMTLENSTISGNSAAVAGGGIHTRVDSTDVATLDGCTISGNTAGSGGGGGVSDWSGVTVKNSTISGNAASSKGGGIYTRGTVTVQNSIVALQTTGVDCAKGSSAVIMSNGYNIESGISCGFNGTGDQRTLTNTTLKLQALADNGGPTQTMALDSGSVAIDQIADGVSGCVAGTSTDQRGAVRAGDNVPAGSGVNRGGTACDVGAYEYDSNQNPNAVVLSDLFAVTGSPGGVLAGLGALLAAGLGGVAFWRRRRVRADPTRQTPTRGSPSLATDSAKAVYISPAINFDAPLEVRAGSPLNLPLDDLIE